LRINSSGKINPGHLGCPGQALADDCGAVARGRSEQVEVDELNGSLLSLAAFLVPGGQLGDLLGRRRVFLTGMVVLAAASACAGLAPPSGY
jgi:hypothetical protein